MILCFCLLFALCERTGSSFLSLEVMSGQHSNRDLCVLGNVAGSTLLNPTPAHDLRAGEPEVLNTPQESVIRDESPVERREVPSFWTDTGSSPADARKPAVSSYRSRNLELIAGLLFFVGILVYAFLRSRLEDRPKRR